MMVSVCVVHSISQLYIYIDLHIESVTSKTERFCLVLSFEVSFREKNIKLWSLLLLRSNTNHCENVIFRPPPIESLQDNG